MFFKSLMQTDNPDDIVSNLTKLYTVVSFISVTLPFRRGVDFQYYSVRHETCCGSVGGQSVEERQGLVKVNGLVVLKRD